MAQKRIPVLETFSWQLPIESHSVTPPALVAGDRYLVPTGATGTWSGKDDNIAWTDGSTWFFDVPVTGWCVFVVDATPALNTYKYYDGSDWALFTSLFSGDYIPQLPAATEDYIPQWEAGGISLKPGKVVTTVVRADGTAVDTHIPTEKAVRDAINELLGATDAMIFKGTIGTGGTVTALPTTHSAGWTYKVITAATYAGKVCEISDMIIAVIDRTGSGNVDADWTVVQTNIDGAVTGPVSSVGDNIATYDGESGKVIQDSGLSLSSVNTHIADATIHFTEASIDHDNILNIGTYQHVGVDSHIATGNIHRQSDYVTALDCIVWSDVAVLPSQTN